MESESSQQDFIQKQAKIQSNKRFMSMKQSRNNQYKSNLNKSLSTNFHSRKRRNAVAFYPQGLTQNRQQIAKSQQAKSRILIALKNDIFFKNLSWDQINSFIQKGKLFETTQQQGFVIQSVDEPIRQFFIVVSGQVTRQALQGSQAKTYYSGQCLCHQSFLHPTKSLFSYICHRPKTLIFSLSGVQINTSIQSINHQKFLFYQKCLLDKAEFNYLDNQEKQKMISCFKERKQIMAGETLLKGEEDKNGQKQSRFYIVLKGKFCKCKKNLSGELMTLKTLNQGDFFGQQNLFYNANPEYCVICLQDNSEIAYLDKKTLQKSIDSYQRIMRRSKMQIKLN